ncbi:hypothetical protein CRYUN_Cryun14cG0076900 [Craigia yunnanensis]
MTGSNIEITVSAILLELYKILIPIDGGRVAAMMVARVTVLVVDGLLAHARLILSIFLMGPLAGVFSRIYGVPLVMEQNFSDYSCQFKFGVHPPLPEKNDTLKEPCLDICPIANKRREIQRNVDVMKYPKHKPCTTS